MDEDQFILRLPPSLAPRLRFALASKAKRESSSAAPTSFNISFISDRHAQFILDGTSYPATLMDLPCLAETHKYTEQRTFYKSGDVGQVLVVRLPDDPDPSSNGSYMLPDGLTPGSKGARDRFAMPPPPFEAQTVSEVENTLKLVVDNKMSFVKKKPTPGSPDAAKSTTADEKNSAGADGSGRKDAGGGEEEIEIEIEGEGAAQVTPGGNAKSTGDAVAGPAAASKPTGAGKSDSAGKSGATSKSGAEGKPGTAGKSGPSGTPGSAGKVSASGKSATAGKPGAAGKPDGAKSEVPAKSKEKPSKSAPSPAPGPIKPPRSSAPSPAPSPVRSPAPLAEPAPAESEEDDDDDFTNMLAESMMEDGAATDAAEGKARIEKANLTRRVEAKRAEVAEQTNAVNRAANPVIRQRVMRRKTELENELKTLTSELDEMK